MEKVRRTPAARFFTLAEHVTGFWKMGVLFGGGGQKDEAQSVTPGSAIKIGKTKEIRG